MIINTEINIHKNFYLNLKFVFSSCNVVRVIIPRVPCVLQQTISQWICLRILDEETETLRTGEKPPGWEGGNENNKSNVGPSKTNNQITRRCQSTPAGEMARGPGAN